MSGDVATPRSGALAIVPHMTTDTAVVTLVQTKVLRVHLEHSGVPGLISLGNMERSYGSDFRTSGIRPGDTFPVVIHTYDPDWHCWHVSPREYVARQALSQMGLACGTDVDACVVSSDNGAAELLIGEHKALLQPTDMPWCAYDILFRTNRLAPGCSVRVRVMRWDPAANVIQVCMAPSARYTQPGDHGKATLLVARLHRTQRRKRLMHHLFAQCEDGSLIRVDTCELRDPLAHFPVGSSIPFTFETWSPYLGLAQARLDLSAVATRPAATLRVGEEMDCVVLYAVAQGYVCLIDDGLRGFLPLQACDGRPCAAGEILRVRVTGLPEANLAARLELVAYIRPKLGYQIHGTTGAIAPESASPADL